MKEGRKERRKEYEKIEGKKGRRFFQKIKIKKKEGRRNKKGKEGRRKE